MCLISGWLGFETFVTEIRSEFRTRLLLLSKFRTSICTEIWIGSVWHHSIRTLGPRWIHRRVKILCKFWFTSKDHTKLRWSSNYKFFSGLYSAMFSTQAHTGYSTSAHSRALCHKLWSFFFKAWVLLVRLVHWVFAHFCWQWSVFGPSSKLERSFLAKR